MTLRLSEEMSSELEFVARVRGTSVAHTIRIAIAQHLLTLAEDPTFQARLARNDEVELRGHDRFSNRTPS